MAMVRTQGMWHGRMYLGMQRTALPFLQSLTTLVTLPSPYPYPLMVAGVRVGRSSCFPIRATQRHKRQIAMACEKIW